MTVIGGAPFSFNYRTWDFQTGLFVRAKVWDVTTGSAVFVSNIVMSDAGTGCYFGIFTGTSGKTYLIDKAVYTDGTYGTIDNNRSPGTDSVQCVNFSPTLQVQEVSGAILDMELQTTTFDLAIETEEVF